ncbi:MAG: deoxyguanosinetriphosphate triphosphohydrolase [Kiritimatiellales bacterium]|nr:deoxyguanosinetriphosphate triphosphohydrolase [Kiritimatiellales bacterium]
MTNNRQAWETLEDNGLAAYAAHSATSRGRRYEEDAHPVRSCFQRDRDRVLHSRCFRRLEYKTQVFVNGTADHYRTRLTHTMEMTAVGRTLARAFRVNEDLTETICLAHDVGHSPFGHRGEDVLNELMKDYGGFDHNLQSLRAVNQLEYQYPGFPGLNLTWEVRAGLLKHEAATPGAELDGRPIGPFQYLEAQIADVADDMSYHAHDVDDGLSAGLITLAQLRKLAFWKTAAARTDEQYTGLDEDQHRRITIRNLLDLQAQDVLTEGRRRLEIHNPHHISDVMNAPERLIIFSDEMAGMLKEFSDFLYQQLYYHPSVADANSEAVELMRGLFLHYVDHPETMGKKARRRLEEEGLMRTVCDYVAGCTDRYALEECEKYGVV